MIFWNLFITFLKIGIVNFGGGYAMLSLIQSEVVTNHNWISSSEFTDIVGVSQMTPGPVGINVATYVGYTATVNDGYGHVMGIFGSVIATFSVLFLPFVLMLLISGLLIKYKDSLVVKTIFKYLQPVVIALIAYAAVVLMNSDNFGSFSVDGFGENVQPLFSILIFVMTFVFVYKYNANIFLLLGICAILGNLVY